MPLPARRTARVLAAGAAFFLALAGGCTESEWPDREPLVVDRVPVDSLEFLPPGARFALEDSLTPVLFRGFRAGYACTRIQAELEEQAFAQPPGFAARVRLELPENPTCPIETAPRDDSLKRRFSEPEGPVIYLLDSLGEVLDTASLVRGRLDFDSLELKAPDLSATRGRFFYRDSVLTLPRVLSADSLSPCVFLNHAEYSRQGDTTKVRFSWVTQDPAPANDSCRGDVHGDTITPLPSRP